MSKKTSAAKQLGRVRAFFGKPANVILVGFLIALCLLTLYPLILLFLIFRTKIMAGVSRGGMKG